MHADPYSPSPFPGLPARIRGVVFDLDGTVVVQTLDFEAMRREIGLPSGTPLLEALETMTKVERIRAEAVFERHEAEAAAIATLLPGVYHFMRRLESRGI